MIRRLSQVFFALALSSYSAGALADEPPAQAAGQGSAASRQEEGVSQEEEDSRGDYETSTTGRKYRVRFDPASRLSLTSGLRLMHDGEGNVVPAFEAGFSFTYRRVYRFGKGEEQIRWQVDHGFPSGVVFPFLRPASEIPSFDATVYRLSVLRHSESPSVVLPMSPPVTLAFPFDVGLDAEFGRVTLPVMPVVVSGFEKPAPWLHLGVVRLNILLDPWRTGQVGRSFALGVGVRYDVDMYAAPDLGKPRFVHRVAPMTSFSVRFRTQTDDGLLMLDAFAESAPHWTSENQWAFMANANVRVDRTLIAINDKPIGVYGEVGYRYLPGGLGANELHDLHGTLGVAGSFGLR